MFIRERTYELVDILDHQGNRRTEQDSCKNQSFYRSLMGCMVQSIQEKKYFLFDRTYAFVQVIQNPDGIWIKRNFVTSPLMETREFENGRVELVTHNSVYCFVPAELKPPIYKNESLLIELYMSNQNDQFCNGFFYDENKEPHQLTRDVHLGMFQDSILIRRTDDDFHEYVCRYFPNGRKIEFYNTVYGGQDYSLPMLIHNTCDIPLEIEFEGFKATWTIQPGESKRIMPYCAEGADQGSCE